MAGVGATVGKLGAPYELREDEGPALRVDPGLPDDDDVDDGEDEYSGWE